MLYDEAAYKLSHNGSIDITVRSDVSQLNRSSSSTACTPCISRTCSRRSMFLSSGVLTDEMPACPPTKSESATGGNWTGRSSRTLSRIFFQPHLDVRLEL